MGFWSDQASERLGTSTPWACSSAIVSGVGALPNSSRVDWVKADTGFHSANVWRGPGRFSNGTNALEMKVSGMITMNEALLMTSTLGTNSPTYAITHENA